MNYEWKVVMSNGNTYSIVNDIESTKEFLEILFNPNSQLTLSCHQLKTGESVAIVSSHVASVEFNLGRHIGN